MKIQVPFKTNLACHILGYVYLRQECCVHTNAAFNMTEYSTINHVNDSERHLREMDLGSGFVHMEE